MATVIGIFENQYSNQKPLTIVRPGTQTRRFTHISDTVKYVIKLLSRINANIIVLQIKIPTQL